MELARIWIARVVNSKTLLALLNNKGLQPHKGAAIWRNMIHHRHRWPHRFGSKFLSKVDNNLQRNESSANNAFSKESSLGQPKTESGSASVLPANLKSHDLELFNLLK